LAESTAADHCANPASTLYTYILDFGVYGYTSYSRSSRF